MKVFILILIVNVIVAVIYLISNIIMKKNKNYMVGFIVMLVCPVLGPIFYLCAYVVYKVFFSEPVDLDDVIFSKERAKAIVGAMEEQERNMVSLEEAIEITNEKDLRFLMMNIVRGDIQNFLYSISLALNSEDTETAHYAAAMLQEALNRFRVYVEKHRTIVLKQEENSMVYAEVLIDYMNRVLEQKVFTDMEQRHYVEIFDEIGEILFANQPEKVSSTHYEALSMRLLEINEYDRSEKWCKRAASYYPNALATYTCQLKLYFSCGEREKFFSVVEELKNSSVVVDSETLELLRVFR
ncbi:MAG: hypothetical protein Q4D51_02675 [Eubacteriales bacterium]|nr:hypothetical protein [Eubacteriales bacterium]